MYTVKFEEDGLAHTLPAEYVCEYNKCFSMSTRAHDSGWTITGDVHHDYFGWVNYFVATHPDYGWVRGDFEEEVEAMTREGYEHFIKNHPPEKWDCMDI